MSSTDANFFVFCPRLFAYADFITNVFDELQAEADQNPKYLTQLSQEWTCQGSLQHPFLTLYRKALKVAVKFRHYAKLLYYSPDGADPILLHDNGPPDAAATATSPTPTCFSSLTYASYKTPAMKHIDTLVEAHYYFPKHLASYYAK
jgi:hypothetical protein